MVSAPSADVSQYRDLSRPALSRCIFSGAPSLSVALDSRLVNRGAPGGDDLEAEPEHAEPDLCDEPALEALEQPLDQTRRGSEQPHGP